MPGRHNSSSIQGGIFGDAPATSAAPPPSNPNHSSVEGGIFGAPVAPAPDTRTAVTKSSVEGGIFGAPTQAPVSARGGMTRSSVEGGIFGGYNHVQAPVTHAPVSKAPIESLAVAGAANAKGNAINLTWDENGAPLQPLPSARSNPNASSIEGGIFGSAPVAKGAAVARSNPNASSIPGGIFG